MFPRTAVAEVLGRMGHSDALVEIWNGVPWMSPLWYRRPRMTIVHHVHGPMWEQSLPWPIAPIGRVVEARVAPALYRRGAVVTPSQSTREELLELGFRPERVTAVDNGVDDLFRPARPRPDEADEPLVIVVGRMAPVKRFELALDAAAAARRRVPGLRLRVIGDGPVRPELEAWIAEHRAGDWVTLVGRIEHEELRDEYRRAWVVLSASLVEGWGLTLTEAGGCGTPAVATDIRGHRSSVADGVTGVLVEPDGLGRRTGAGAVRRRVPSPPRHGRRRAGGDAHLGRDGDRRAARPARRGGRRPALTAAIIRPMGENRTVRSRFRPSVAGALDGGGVLDDAHEGAHAVAPADLLALLVRAPGVGDADLVDPPVARRRPGGDLRLDAEAVLARS